MAWATLGLALSASHPVGAATSTIAYRGADGRLLYAADSNGNTVPDYSYTGYKLGAEPIPDNIPVKATVSPISGDDTANIQSAIDAVEALPLDANGFRGAVYLTPGIYQVSTKLTINQSGVVVKGAGAGRTGTIIHHVGVPATGNDAKTFDVGPVSGGLIPGAATEITSSYVPVGTKQVTVASTSGLSVGDRVVVKSVPTAAWVAALGLQDYWTPTPTWSYDAITIVWERKIVSINTTTKTLQFDHAFSSIIDTGSGYTVATVAKIVSDQRLSQVGIEDIMFVSDYDRGETSDGYYNDEDHADRAVEFVQAQDSWMRRCTGYFYSDFFVKVNRGSYRLTIEDCAMYDGVSLDTPRNSQGTREYYFSLDGKNTLVQRCYARGGRHAFVLNGPTNHNVFLHCYSEDGHYAQESHQTWGSAVLFDNVYSDSQFKVQGNLSLHGQGSSNTMLWNCVSESYRGSEPEIWLNSPAAGLGTNWVVGALIKGVHSNPSIKNYYNFGAPGVVDSLNTPVYPRSLFMAQTRDRIGEQALYGTVTNEQYLRPDAIYAKLRARFASAPGFADPAAIATWAPPVPTFDKTILQQGYLILMDETHSIAEWSRLSPDATFARSGSTSARWLNVNTATAEVILREPPPDWSG